MNNRKIIGGIGMLISAIGFIFSLRKKKLFLASLFLVSFISSSIFFYTGTENYAVVMLGRAPLASKMMSRDFLKGPVITAQNKEDLKNIMEQYEKYYLWLPCAKGGVWYKKSKYFYTRWNLPMNSVQCPDGKYLIKYGESL